MIIPNSALDKQRWDNRVLREKPAGFFFLLSWYLDVIDPNWEGYVIGEYEAIFPIVTKQKMGVNYTVMPFLTRTFNPIGFNSEQEKELSSYLAARFSYIQLAGPSLTEPFEQHNRKYQTLDLTKFELGNCSENHRRQYKKAKQQGFELNPEVNPERLIKIFREVKGSEFTHLNETAYRVMDRLMEEANKQGCLKQYSLISNGSVIGVAAYLVVADQALYLKGAIKPEAMKIGGMVYLHVEAMMSLKTECKQLDFGGSNAKGLGDFNRKFGARDQEYLLLIKNSLPKPLAWIAKRKLG